MIKRILFIAFLGLTGAWIVRSFMIEGVWVASGSMEPTLVVGTHYLVNKMVYHLHAPVRGEIIVLKDPVDSQKGLIKRVIAVGGDQIQIKSKQVILNGKPLTEPYTVYTRASERLLGDNIPEMTVPPDQYFVLGDNRDQSEDSTSWKDPKTGEHIYFVQRQDIQGRLVIP